MKLATAAYVSEAARGLGLRELKAILRRSREHNFRSGVTGYLVFDGAHFAQLLEGEAGVVDATLARIRADARHHDVHDLIHEPITQRCFEGWCMGCANLAAPVRLDTSELRGVIGDFVGARDLSLSETQAFFRLFAEFRNPEQAALLSL
jgi:hypothetical protein